MKPIDIVVTTWQREWMTEACLEALQKNTKTPHRIILIDNGSSPHAQAFYRTHADIYVKLDRNYGLEYAKNLGMRFVESELFVSMDNDILVCEYEPDWLDRLVGLLTKYPQYAAIACKPQQLVGTGMSMFETKDEIVPFHHVPGYARLMRTGAVRDTGSWEEKRPLRGHEELWIGEALERYGWKMAWANNIECIHLWGKSYEDNWGYPAGTESGHNPIWPRPTNDDIAIMKKTGVNVT